MGDRRNVLPRVLLQLRQRLWYMVELWCPGWLGHHSQFRTEIRCFYAVPPIRQSVQLTVGVIE
jgi:hypothetical protein